MSRHAKPSPAAPKPRTSFRADACPMTFAREYWQNLTSPAEISRFSLLIVILQVAMVAGLDEAAKEELTKGPTHGGAHIAKLLKFLTVRTEHGREKLALSLVGGRWHPTLDGGNPTRCVFYAVRGAYITCACLWVRSRPGEAQGGGGTRVRSCHRWQQLRHLWPMQKLALFCVAQLCTIACHCVLQYDTAWSRSARGLGQRACPKIDGETCLLGRGIRVSNSCHHNAATCHFVWPACGRACVQQGLKPLAGMIVVDTLSCMHIMLARVC